MEILATSMGESVPWYATDGAAGADLRTVESFTLGAGMRLLVRTGVAVAIPDGFVGLVVPRSGLASRHGLSIVNSPGVIDSDYRGEVHVNLINLDPKRAVVIGAGARIAQLLIVPVARAEFRQVDELPPSERGVGGHGSTGIS